MIYKRLFESVIEDYYKLKFGVSPNRLTPYEQLEKYKDNSNIYISFRSINKIGINPKSKYDTPNGIYTYPLKEIWSEFNHTEKQINVPFAGDASYIYVIEAEGKGLNLQKYFEENLIKDLKILEQIYKPYIQKDNIFTWNIIINNYKLESRVKDSSGYIWNITRNLSQEGTGIYKGKNANKWNFILNKDLGYNYVVDKGDGIIHPNEPIQAVFFNTKSFTVKDIIVNK